MKCHYQKGAIQKIFQCFESAVDDYHLLYQLPTGGGKTVIFSEIVSQYLKTRNKKVLVMTHRIELCKQTSNVLSEFGVRNKVVDSKAKLDDQNDYDCFVAGAGIFYVCGSESLGRCTASSWA